MEALAAQIEALAGQEERLRTKLSEASDQLSAICELRSDLTALKRELQSDLTALRWELQGALRGGGLSGGERASGTNRYPYYQQLIDGIRAVVPSIVPPDATVMVVSKGDNQLLQLSGRTGWHFPQQEDGMYAGYYPADSTEAIAHLEALRAKGADYLLFPVTAFWWLDHYADLRRHLEINYRRIWSDEHCIIYRLQRSQEVGLGATLKALVSRRRSRVAGSPRP